MTHLLLLLLSLVSAQAATPPTPMENPAQSPDRYKVRFDTTAGRFVVTVDRSLAPRGADRLYDLVRRGYYDDGIAIYRVLDGFVAQFGLHGDPDIADAWRNARIPDDPVLASNDKKWVTFAMAGKNTRTTQLFINLTDNSRLDDLGFAPVGKITSGWGTIKKLFSLYGEGPPAGTGPDQNRIQDEGNAYLKANYPRLDYITNADLL